MSDEKYIKFLEDEANKVTVLLNFLINNPSAADSLVGGNSIIEDNVKKIKTMNVIRVLFVRKWANEMINIFERIYGKDFVKELKQVEEILEVREVKR